MPTEVVDYAMLEASKLFKSILVQVSNEIVGSKDFTLANDSEILLRAKKKLNRYKHLGMFENSMSPNATGINSCEASSQKDTHFIGEQSANLSVRVKNEQKSDLPRTPNKSEKFSSIADRMTSTSFMSWVDQWKDQVAKQSIRNQEIREMGMMTIPDQGIGFDQEGLPYELNNPPPHVTDRSFPPLSDPNVSKDCSRAKRESVPVSGFTGGGGDPPSGDSDDNGSDSESSDESGDDRNPSSDESDDQAGSGSSNGTTSIRGANPSNVNRSNSSQLLPGHRQLKTGCRSTYQPGNLDVDKNRGWGHNSQTPQRELRDEMCSRLSRLILWAVGRDYVGTPIKIKLEEPTKWNRRNPSKFEEWLQSVLRYIDLTGMSGPAYDSQHVRFLGICLDGEALAWYNAVVDPIYSMGQVRAWDWTFSEAVWALYSHFVHNVALNNATHDFKHVVWRESTGISGLYFDLVKYVSWMLNLPTDSAMVDCIMNQIPSDMREWLIDKKNIWAHPK